MLAAANFPDLTNNFMILNINFQLIYDQTYLIHNQMIYFVISHSFTNLFVSHM